MALVTTVQYSEVAQLESSDTGATDRITPLSSAIAGGTNPYVWDAEASLPDAGQSRYDPDGYIVTQVQSKFAVGTAAREGGAWVSGNLSLYCTAVNFISSVYLYVSTWTSGALPVDGDWQDAQVETSLQLISGLSPGAYNVIALNAATLASINAARSAGVDWSFALVDPNSDAGTSVNNLQSKQVEFDPDNAGNEFELSLTSANGGSGSAMMGVNM